MEVTAIEMSEELRNQCMSIFKYVRDCYGTEVTKSILFREFNISENNKEKIFKFLESNGIKLIKGSKEPQKKALGNKKLPNFDDDNSFGYSGFKPQTYNPKKATIVSEGKITASKSNAKSLADSIIKRTAEEMQKKKEHEKKILEALKQVSVQGYYGKVRSGQF